MIWHAFNIARGLSPEYWSLDRALIGAHQLLLLTCAAANEGRGNSGIWKSCTRWDARAWVRYTGLDKGEIDALVTAGLARWVTNDVADALVAELTPTDAETHEEEFDWERCRVTDAALDQVERRQDDAARRSRSTQLVDRDRHASSIAIDRDRSPDRSEHALVVFDYDLGGQVKAQLLSEMKRKAANARWNQKRQLPLAGVENAPTPEPTQLVDRDRSRDRRGAADARAMHSHSHSTDPDQSPPSPPSRGGRQFVVPNREELAQLEAFWSWFLRAVPRSLQGQRWGGAKEATLKALCKRAAGDPLAILAKAPVSIEVLTLSIRSDLMRKFRSERWVRNMAESGIGFRSYVNADQWKDPLPDDLSRPSLELVRDPEESKQAIADRNMLALLADPEVPEERKASERERWIAQNPGERPPWLTRPEQPTVEGPQP